MSSQQALGLEASPWFQLRDGDPRLRPIYNRHYSSRGNTAPKITGPGSYVALLTHDLGALFAWRKFDDDCPLAPVGGVNCAVFRRERGQLPASALILAAEPYALEKWPAAPALYTYVAPDKVQSRNPGYCFKRAGYVSAGLTAGGHGRPRLLVLVKPLRAPAA
jgi:hypothetical protein